MKEQNMAHYTDWLPAKRALQLAMAKNWYAVLNRKAQKWGIPNNVGTELEGLMEKAQDALSEAMSSARTAVITARCKAAFDTLIAKMRDIKKRYFLQPPLKDEDMVSLELSPPDTTPIPPPTAQAEADLTFPGIHLVELKKIRTVAGSGSAQDGKSDYGVRIFWGLTGPAVGEDKFRVTEAPGSGKDLPHSKFTRRHKELFDFDGESGNTVYFCLRYENPKGDAGPFGPMLKAVIP
jgi:hypothetical protein